jgi:hypothetical protein
MRRNASTGREAWTFGRKRFPSVHLHVNRQARTDQEREVAIATGKRHSRAYNHRCYICLSAPFRGRELRFVTLPVCVEVTVAIQFDGGRRAPSLRGIDVYVVMSLDPLPSSRRTKTSINCDPTSRVNGV